MNDLNATDTVASNTTATNITTTDHYNQIPHIFTINGQLKTNTKDVAAFFGKRHANVLRSVREMDCSSDFRNCNYELTETSEKVGIAVRTTPSYNMTRTGFIALVMGFTGISAWAFKEAYFAQFNAMESYMAEKLSDEAARREVSRRMRHNNPLLTPAQLSIKQARDKANRERQKCNRIGALTAFK